MNLFDLFENRVSLFFDEQPGSSHVVAAGILSIHAEANHVLVVEHGRNHVNLARVVELEQQVLT